jgi:hypothetical protein
LYVPDGFVVPAGSLCDVVVELVGEVQWERMWLEAGMGMGKGGSMENRVAENIGWVEEVVGSMVVEGKMVV